MASEHTMQIIGVESTHICAHSTCVHATTVWPIRFDHASPVTKCGQKDEYLFFEGLALDAIVAIFLCWTRSEKPPAKQIKIVLAAGRGGGSA